MRTVRVTLNSADLSREMEEMREWLDRSGYETRRFDCNQHGESVIVSVEFMLDTEADAFAAHFSSNPIPPFIIGPLGPADHNNARDLSVIGQGEPLEVEGIKAASSVKSAHS